MTVLTSEQVRACIEFTFSGERIHPSIRIATAIVDAQGDVLAVAGETGAGDEAHAKTAIESLGLVADVEGLDVEW